jgi:hypothetical protein
LVVGKPMGPTPLGPVVRDALHYLEPSDGSGQAGGSGANASGATPPAGQMSNAAASGAH